MSRAYTSGHVRRRTHRLSAFVSMFAAVLLGACATTPTEEEQAPVFYPPLPNPPRIQFLASFSEAKDVGDEPSAFARFVAGEETEDRHLVKKPYGVSVYQGRIYLVDTRGGGYGVFDLVKRRADFILGGGGGSLQKPINITIDKDGTKYITDTDREQILVYSAEDKFLRAFGVEGQFKPGDVAIVGDKLYVTDLNHHQIHVLDKVTGKTLFRFGKTGSKEGELFFPTNLAVSEDGFLFVSDTGNFRVQKYTLEGRFVRSFGSIGTRLGQFARPKGIALDREGRMYVVDAAFGNVQLFDRNGRLLLFFGEAGERRESINLPTAIHIDYDNVRYFQKYADPKFKLEYVILVASQFGRNKVAVFGFGRMDGMEYPEMIQPLKR